MLLAHEFMEIIGFSSTLRLKLILGKAGKIDRQDALMLGVVAQKETQRKRAVA